MPKRLREPLPDLTLEQLRERMRSLGVTRILVKELAPNDNSKNQPYLSGSLDVINIIPAGDVEVTTTDEGNRIMKAPLPLEWLQPDGGSIPAPNAKLILYPQYPEVRFSGFLKGAVNAPNDLLTTREKGRLLFFGITKDRRIIAWGSRPGSQLDADYHSLGELEKEGVFRRVPLFTREPKDNLSILLAELRRIHLLDWIASKRMSGGIARPYQASNGIGYTLEAELGVSNNGSVDPDFEGWEVKAAQVRNFLSVPPSKRNTLLTPEPDGGAYQAMSFPDFIRQFGYADRRGRADRMNFGGVFRIGRRHALTGLTTKLLGFDAESRQITDVDGQLVLANDAGLEVASWSFSKLLTHWNTKHAKAVYVPGELRNTPDMSYRFGPKVYLGQGTNFNLFLGALCSGNVFFDPGMKLENISYGIPAQKKRSQFRILWRHVPDLYDTMTETILQP